MSSEVVSHADGGVAEGKAALLVERHVVIPAIQDDFVAAGSKGHLLEKLNNAPAEPLAYGKIRR